MPFPASLTPITLTGTFLDGDSLPRQGVVKVLMPTPIRSEGDDVVIPPFELAPIDLDENGFFTVDLPPTTDPDWLPNTAEYVVMAEFTEDYRKLWWSFPLPHDGGALDLADAGEPNVGTPALTIRQGSTQPLADGGFRDTYDAGRLYRAGDTVVHSSAVYGALRPSEGVVPGTDVTVWRPFPGVGGAPIAHAASHAAAGSDPVTLTQGQITGLTAALALLAPLLNPTFAGDVNVVDLIASGRIQIDGSGKSYRLRTGGALDFEGSGADLFISVWSAAGFSGTQRTFLRLEGGANIATAVHRWRFAQDPDGTGMVMDVNATTGEVVVTGDLSLNGGAVPNIFVYDGADYVPATGAGIYVGPVDPGAVPQGSIWYEVAVP